MKRIERFTVIRLTVNRVWMNYGPKIYFLVRLEIISRIIKKKKEKKKNSVIDESMER